MVVLQEEAAAALKIQSLVRGFLSRKRTTAPGFVPKHKKGASSATVFSRQSSGETVVEGLQEAKSDAGGSASQTTPQRAKLSEDTSPGPSKVPATAAPQESADVVGSATTKRVLTDDDHRRFYSLKYNPSKTARYCDWTIHDDDTVKWFQEYAEALVSGSKVGNFWYKQGDDRYKHNYVWESDRAFNAKHFATRPSGRINGMKYCVVMIDGKYFKADEPYI